MAAAAPINARRRPAFWYPAIGGLLAVAFFSSLPFLVDNYILSAGILAFIFLFPALGLNLIFGYTGLLSFAQGAFFGIGAYTSAVLALQLNLPFWITFPAAGLSCAVVAVIVAAPSLRLSSYSFVMVTLGFVVIAQAVSQNWISVTDGNMGLIGVPRPVIGSPDSGLVLNTVVLYYYFALGLAVLGILAFAWLVTSPAGRSMRAIRDDETLAAASGIPVRMYKTIVFACSAAFAGIGGAIEAHYLSVVSPQIFDMYYTNSILIIVLAGGAGTFWAVPISTVVFIGASQVLSIAPEAQQAIFGVLLLVLVFLLPKGFGPLAVRAARGLGGCVRWRRRT